MVKSRYHSLVRQEKKKNSSMTNKEIEMEIVKKLELKGSQNAILCQNEVYES